MLTEFLNALINVVWSDALVAICFGIGIFYTFRSRFVQLRLIPAMIKLSFDRHNSTEGISAFQSFCTALGGRIGTGNISGTALAIFYGGPGSIFWLWVISFFGAATAYAEAALAQLWKKQIDGEYRGGPAYYIESGLGSRGFAMMFAVVAILSCGLLLPAVQANAIAIAFKHAAAVPPVVSGVINAVLLAAVICGGLKRIASAMEMVVPIMGGFYLLVSMAIIIANIDQLAEVMRLIVSSALGVHPILGAIAGMALRYGVRRGIFANEAGLGTAAHAAAAAEVSHPAKQGLVQAFSVYVDTIFFCTLTGLMILLSDCYNVIGNIGIGGSTAISDGACYLYIGSGQLMDKYAKLTDIGGTEFVQAAVNSLLSHGGALIVAICIGFFAFTSLIAYYYQAETNIAFIFKSRYQRKNITRLLRLMICSSVIFASVNSASVVWLIGDIGSGVMSWINIIALLQLSGTAIYLLEDWQSGNDVFKSERSKIYNAPLWRKRKQ